MKYQIVRRYLAGSYLSVRTWREDDHGRWRNVLDVSEYAYGDNIEWRYWSMIGRMFSGEKAFQNVYTAQGGEGMIAFASSFPGSIKRFNHTGK